MLTLAEKGVYNNTAGLVLSQFDTCPYKSYRLVWLPKQQPASTLDIQRDFVISSTAFPILERHHLVKQKEEQMPAPFHHKEKQNAQCKSY
jgi:hypothetical protein